MANSNNLFGLPKIVLAVDESIEYCAVIDKYGHIFAREVRKSRQRAVSKDAEERGAIQSAIRNFNVPSWARQFGEIYYNVTRHEKIIGAAMPMSKDYLMIVAFDVTANNFDEIIMQRIMPLIKEYKSKSIGTQPA